MRRDIQVPIPENCTAYRNGRVFEIDKRERSGHDPDKTAVGYVEKDCREGFMHPNSYYMESYKTSYLVYNPKGQSDLKPEVLGIGLFALLLAIGIKTGVYPLLCEVFGVYLANGIMDFAMYSISERLNCANTFAERMSNQVLFSIFPHSEDWYSDMFSQYIKKNP